MTSNTCQHFVPQFYLRGWSDHAERVWQYPVTGAKPSHVRVKNIAFERGLYSHPAADKTAALKTEKDLASIESLYAPAWPGIIDRAQDSRTRRNLARFIALTTLRHPQHQAAVQRVNANLRRAVKDIPSDQTVEFHEANETFSCLAGDILNGTNDDKETIRSTFLRSMHESVEDIAEALFRRRWGVIFSEHPAFVTSDCPVVLDRGACRKPALGFGTAGTLVLFPFCPKRLLVIDDLWPHDFAHYKLTQADVYNRFIAQGAVRFVYCSANETGLAAKLGAWRK